MTNAKLKWPVLVITAIFVVNAGFSQEVGALLNVLIRKGVLTNQEAEDIRAELVVENNVVPARVFAGGKSTDRLSVGMRMQLQYANLDTDIRGVAIGPPATDHFFTRRMYLTLKAGLGTWGAVMTYDFAGGSYDDAFVEWKANADLSFNFGLRKVNVGYEERASSGNLKSIERSGVTRYFVEANNGRRLGAASYRIGAFLDGKRDVVSDVVSVVYSAAVTAPERNETFTLASASGDNTSNHVALWANLGLSHRLVNERSWIFGVGAGYLPDQGGFGAANLGRGFDLTLYSVYADMTFGRFGLMAEYLTANVERGRATPGNGNAWPRGYFIQPSLLLTETIEAVVRYQWLDSDARGVNLGDVVRSAPAGPTMNKFNEWYAGVNWYLRGNDLKFQLGGIYGETKETVTGAPAKAKTVGARSQVQLQF
jgi:phosphate-selective porin